MSAVVDAIAPISLDELDAVAALRTRRDTKYVVDSGTAVALLEAFGGDVQVLEVEDRRSTRFESLYFDTGDFALHRAAAQARRDRFKVRTRRYADQSTTVLEVKRKTGRGETIKHRLTDRTGEQAILDDGDRRFVDEVVGRLGAATDLVPTLTTSYARTTLVVRDEPVRVTLDEDLVCTDWARRSIALDAVIIETKSTSGRSAIDRWLWAQGSRPLRISKYCTALAILQPGLPANRWRRTIRRHFS